MRASALFLTLSVVAGCSSKVVGSDPVSTIDPARTLDSLSATEAEQYCGDVNAYSKKAFDSFDGKRFGCAVMAPLAASGTKTDAEAATACKKAFDDCLAKPTTATPTKETSSCKSAYSDLQKCKGTGTTVGDMNACLEAVTGELMTMSSYDPCSTLKAGGAGAKSPTAGPEASPQCKALQAKCPAAFSSTSSTSSDPSPAPGSAGAPGASG